MSLTERLNEDLKAAMRAGDTIARETLRMVLAGVKNARIERGEDLSDDDVLAVVQKAVKSRKDAITQFRDGGRDDLADKEEKEVAVLAAYLPQQLSAEETRAIVQGLVEELGIESKKDMGRLMKELMARHKGQLDGKLAQQAAADLIPG